MAYKMQRVSPSVRMGIDKGQNFHIEKWPMDEGWHRDIDPALPSGDPERIRISADDALSLFNMLNHYFCGSVYEVMK